MDRVVMDEMMGLFCVDIVVALDIFPTEAVPRYAMYNEKGFVQICLFLVPGTEGLDLAYKIEGILRLLSCVLCVTSEILSLE